MSGNRWEEIVERMKESIRTGALKPGERLPSETEFASGWGISRMTAHRVMRELQSAGLVERRRRTGTFVSLQRRLQTVAVLLHNTRLNPQASYLQGISEGLGNDYDLLLCDTGGSREREAEVLASLPQRADGAIVFPTSAPENTSRLAELRMEMPIVCIDRVPDGLEVDAVMTDEFESSLEGMRLLTGRGHRRIAYLTNESFHISTVRGRLDAYLTALAEVGGLQTQWLRALTGDGKTFREFAEEVHRTLEAMMRGPERPTALFCVQDDYMAAALASCERQGLRVPEDLEILSINDTPMLPIFHLEDVHRIVPQTVEMGRLAARRVIRLAASPDSEPEIVCLRADVVAAAYPTGDLGSSAAPSNG